ncbi:hypothetical protein NC652_040524 [Populus alba x Populus x berolinensis]|nr:hypothetical protein NC652_040524 [Populus alba x Populus x berolinensis]
MQETLLATLSENTKIKAKNSKDVSVLALSPFHIVTTRTRSQPKYRRVTPTRDVMTTTITSRIDTGCSLVEKVLPNGDIYTGGLVDGVPHGKGKYLWCDGCMFEGEWRRGKANGATKPRRDPKPFLLLETNRPPPLDFDLLLTAASTVA